MPIIERRSRSLSLAGSARIVLLGAKWHLGFWVASCRWAATRPLRQKGGLSRGRWLNSIFHPGAVDGGAIQRRRDFHRSAQRRLLCAEIILRFHPCGPECSRDGVAGN